MGCIRADDQRQRKSCGLPSEVGLYLRQNIVSAGETTFGNDVKMTGMRARDFEERSLRLLPQVRGYRRSCIRSDAEGP